MKHFLNIPIVIFIIFQTSLDAQTDLNQYKYVSVPDRFDFLKTNDQYQINSLTQFLLTKKGFTVLESIENYPSDLAANSCLLLDVNVEKIKGFLKTKLEVQFINCKKEVVFRSAIGTSKEKDFKMAYHQAIRAAFDSMEALNYNYKASDAIDISYSIEPSKTVLSKPSVHKPSDPIVVASVDPVDSLELTKTLIVSTAYGYDINDANGKVLYSIYQTMEEGIFIIDKLPGIAYKRGKRWVREYVLEKKTVIEPLVP
tara:strand:+ start:209 stop:976 length:768 start_codon:yes stop_codon:yes gene_type:complete